MSFFSGITDVLTGEGGAHAQRAAAGDAADRIEAGKSEALGYQAPYAKFGQQALSPLSALLLGKSYDPTNGQFSDINPDQRMASFLQSPGYQFNLSQGLSAINKSQVAKGGSLSGGALKEINDYAQGTASNEYQNFLNNLFTSAGIGQNAANQQSNITTGAATNLSSLAYAGGMGEVNKYNNMTNLVYGLVGGAVGDSESNQPGINSQSNIGSAANKGNMGRYNSSYVNSAGAESLGPSTVLMAA